MKLGNTLDCDSRFFTEIQIVDTSNSLQTRIDIGVAGDGVKINRTLLTLSVFLIILIGRRRNFGRWAVLVVFLMSWYSMATNPILLLTHQWLPLVTDAIGTIADVLILRLLFFGEGARWFKMAARYS